MSEQISNNISSNNKRLAKNTVVLYIRMIFIVLISLYTSRVVLNTLGVNDYGIYNVVGGFVTMFSLLSSSLSNAISRFITFELGKGDFEKLNRVFSSSVTVQIILSIIIGILLEIIGIWFLNNKMQIPSDRLFAANWTLQCSILTFIINLISIPYNGCIIAHERMTAFAYISVLDVLLKLGAVVFLYVAFADKLITYSVLLALSAVIVRVVYGIYCSRNFEECKYTFFIDKSLINEMMSMASWNFLGSGGAILSNQGVNLLINLFFGVALNAARGIAVQVNSAVQQFAGSFITAINPQITKAYAMDKHDQMRLLFYKGTKYSYFLMFFIALPIVIETPEILRLWLKIVPDYTVSFVRLTICMSLTSVLSNLLFTVAMATGNIKRYQIVVGSLSISVFVWTYIAYKIGLGVEATYYISLIVDAIILIARLYIVNTYVEIDIIRYFKMVISKVLLVTLISSIIPFILYYILSDNIINMFLIIVISFISTFITIYGLGISQTERKFLHLFIKNKIHI